jgi:hypothetical protein
MLNGKIVLLDQVNINLILAPFKLKSVTLNPPPPLKPNQNVTTTLIGESEDEKDVEGIFIK